jgi:hypothetical protein
MRSIKELLLLLREAVEGPEFRLGMCGMIKKMFLLEEISELEQADLYSYLDDNEPEDTEAYWFPLGQRYPRINWINEQLEKL